MVAKNVAELLNDHVTLEVESIDRMYLNGYVPPVAPVDRQPRCSVS